MRERQFDRLFDLLDLRLEATHVRVALRRRLVELHHADAWVGVLREHTDDSHRLVVQEDAAAGLQEILVDEAHDADIVLGARRAAHDRMLVVNDLLERAHGHGASANIVHARALFGILVVLGPQAVLVHHKLLLEEEVVLDALQLQQLQAAPCRRIHARELRGRVRVLLLLPHTRRHGRLPLLGLFLLRVSGLHVPCWPGHPYQCHDRAHYHWVLVPGCERDWRGPRTMLPCVMAGVAGRAFPEGATSRDSRGGAPGWLRLAPQAAHGGARQRAAARGGAQRHGLLHRQIGPCIDAVLSGDSSVPSSHDPRTDLAYASRI